MGQDYAGFLLGLPTSGTFDSKESSAANAKYFALFLQDNWRMRSNLTLNLGFRWEHETPATERYNRAVNGFNESAASPIAAAALAAYALSPVPQIPMSQFRVNGGLTFASASNPGLYSTKSELFSPRFGFAWKPDLVDRKMVVRGWIGRLYLPDRHSQCAGAQPGGLQPTDYVYSDE